MTRVTAKIFQRYFLGGCRLFQLVCAGFGSIANEPAALKQCITVRAAQNVNHIEISMQNGKGSRQRALRRDLNKDSRCFYYPVWDALPLKPSLKIMLKPRWSTSRPLPS